MFSASTPCTRVLRTATLAVILATFTGCASYRRIASYPTPDQPARVSVAATPMSKMSELPIGVYYDEPRHIIVTGHQKGLFTGMMFGVVGVLVADSVNRSSGAEKFGAEASKGADLGSLLDEILVESLATSGPQRWTKVALDGDLRLTPYAIFTVEKTGEARLYAMLRAELPGPEGKPTWSARYFVRASGLHRLEESGWMAEDRFAVGMRAALQRAVQACVDDTHGRLTGTQTIKAKGRFAYISQDVELPAILVQEAPDEVVAKLAVGDAMVLAGTHVLTRADYEVTPATFKDPRK